MSPAASAVRSCRIQASVLMLMFLISRLVIESELKTSLSSFKHQPFYSDFIYSSNCLIYVIIAEMFTNVSIILNEMLQIWYLNRRNITDYDKNNKK